MKQIKRNRRSMVSRTRNAAVLLAVGSVGMLTPGLRAADIVYSLIPNDLNFSGINWALGTDPTAAPTQSAGLTDGLFFGGTPTINGTPATTLNNDLTGAAFTGITFNADAAAFTINGNAFTLGGSLTNNSAATQTISPAITLDAVRTLNAAFSSSVAFNPGTIVLSGNVTGTGGFIKTGAGTATLGGANSYTGGTTVSAGSLIAKRTTQVALGTGAVTVASGANVTIQDHAGGGQLAYTNAFNLTGSGINGGGALRFLNSGGFAVTGPVSISGGTTIATDPVTQSTTSLINFSTAAIISGSGGLNLVGQGSAAAGTPQLRLDAANTYSGDTRLTSSGINTTPFTVTLQGTSANRLPVATNLIFGGTPAGATGTFDSSVTLALNNTAQTVAGLSTANTPATGQAYRITGINGNTAVFVVANAAANTYNGSFGGGVGTVTNNIQLNKTGAGLLTLGGDSSYAGTGNTLANGKVAGYGTVIGVVTTAGAATADVTTGSILATSNNAFGTGAILLSSTSTGAISSVQLSGGITLPAVNTLTLSTPRTAGTNPALRNVSGDNTFSGITAIASSGAGAFYIQSDAGTLTLSGNLTATNPAAIYGFQGAGNISVTGNITTTTNGTVVKNGTGLLTLGGTNTYTGVTTINAGSILATNSGAFGTGTITVPSGASTSGVQLQGNISLPSTNTINVVGARNIATAGPVLQNLSGNNTFAGNVSINGAGGNGANIQSDAGTLTLSGTLLSFDNGRIYAFQGAGNFLVTGVISGTAGATAGTGAAVNKTGTGTLTLANTNTYGGATTITGGTIALADGGTFGGGAVANGGNVAFVNTGGLSVSNVISGTGTVSQTGTGTTTLTGANTYTGATSVTSGRLRLTNATAINSVITNAGGIDLGNSGGILNLDYGTGASPVATVKTLLDARYNATTPGSAANFMTGEIRSSTLTADRIIGYGDNGTGTVTLRVTLPGDADLDGDVDFSDFLALQTSFGTAGTRFDQGNFNYDGQTDFSDFLVLQTNFGQSLNPSAVAFTQEQVGILNAFFAAESTVVPEPASLAVLGLGAMAVLRRRRSV